MNVAETLEQVKQLGLQQEFPEAMSWDQYVEELDKVAKDDLKLRDLMRMKKKEERVEETSLDKVMSSGFESAKETIDLMTLPKRIKMLEEVNTYREYLYETISVYGEQVSRDEQITATEFRAILGRIKHLEILQNWLYGII